MSTNKTKTKASSRNRSNRVSSLKYSGPDAIGNNDFLVTETRFVEASVAGCVRREELEERLRDWSFGLALECGHRVLLFVFPRAPRSNRPYNVVGWVRTAFSPAEMGNEWKRTFAGLWDRDLGAEAASAPVIGPAMTVNSQPPQEAADTLIAAAFMSLPDSGSGMGPFVIDEGDLALSKATPAGSKGSQRRAVVERGRIT